MQCKSIINMMTGSDPLVDLLPILVFIVGFALVRFVGRRFRTEPVPASIER